VDVFVPFHETSFYFNCTQIADTRGSPRRSFSNPQLIGRDCDTGRSPGLISDLLDCSV
ncbi:unnamed protein product, partial [Candidula unifasciata]